MPGYLRCQSWTAGVLSGLLSSRFIRAAAGRETARSVTWAGQELSKCLPEPWCSGFLPAGEGSCLPENTDSSHLSGLATSVIHWCQMLILFYCTELSKPSYPLCLSIKDALFFMGHCHHWDVSVFMQHLQNSFLLGFVFFVFWSTWTPLFAILSGNCSEVLHTTTCDFCCAGWQYSPFFFFSFPVHLLHSLSYHMFYIF